MKELEQKLGYSFRDRSLLENALRHSSFANESRDRSVSSNERLEFLGDSVLGFVTAKHLYKGLEANAAGCFRGLSCVNQDLALLAACHQGHGSEDA